jgi:hypothetical protein
MVLGRQSGSLANHPPQGGFQNDLEQIDIRVTDWSQASMNDLVPPSSEVAQGIFDARSWEVAPRGMPFETFANLFGIATIRKSDSFSNLPETEKAHVGETSIHRLRVESQGIRDQI